MLILQPILYQFISIGYWIDFLFLYSIPSIFIYKISSPLRNITTKNHLIRHYKWSKSIGSLHSFVSWIKTNIYWHVMFTCNYLNVSSRFFYFSYISFYCFFSSNEIYLAFFFSPSLESNEVDMNGKNKLEDWRRTDERQLNVWKCFSLVVLYTLLSWRDQWFYCIIPTDQ